MDHHTLTKNANSEPVCLSYNLFITVFHSSEYFHLCLKMLLNALEDSIQKPQYNSFFLEDKFKK
jgi:hypothetical protein